MLSRINGVKPPEQVRPKRGAERFRKNGRAGSRETIRLPAQDAGKSWSYAITRRWPRVAFRWKNSAWLTTADTVAGWNGLGGRKGRSRRRAGAEGLWRDGDEDDA